MLLCDDCQCASAAGVCEASVMIVSVLLLQACVKPVLFHVMLTDVSVEYTV